MNDTPENDPRLYAIPDIHGHAKGEHKAFSDERPIPLSARMLFLWFYHACRRGWPRFLMVTDHMNYLTFEDPAAINLVRRALKLAQAGDLYGAAETASVEVGHAAVVSEGLRRGMRYSIGAEVDNDPRSRPDAQNIVDAMKPDGMIRSVHFLTIDHPAHGPGWSWPFDNPEFSDVHELIGTAKTWELYMTTLLDAVERLPGNILGHFYVPALFGNWPDAQTLEGYEDQIVDACEARGMAIEFNTRFLYRDHSDEQKAAYLEANRRLLLKCKAKNVGIAVGSDAHSPKDQGRGFATVLALLDECAINELVFPIAGRLARVALRIERKIEPVSEPAALPAAAPAEDRKAARKARAGESPAREATPTAVATVDEPAEPAKVKSRSKRVKAKPPVAADIVAGAEFTPAESVDIPTDVSEAILVAEPVFDARADLAEVVVVVEPDLSDAVADIVTDAVFEPILAEPSEAVGEEPASAVDSGVAADEREPLDDREPFLDDEAAIIVEPPSPLVADREPVGEHSPPRKSQPPAAPSRSKAAAGKAKTTAAKPAAKKSAKPAAKAVVKKAPAKKAAAKKAPAKKATPVKAKPSKAAPKKAPAKKTAVRAAASKKSAAKKSPAKKAPAKKPARRR